MPELPDLVHVVGKLDRALSGRVVTGGRLGDPTPIRQLIAEPLPASLVGRALTSIERRGHFVRLAFGDRLVVINAMLTGKYLLSEPKPGARMPAALIFSLAFEGPLELAYHDDKRMGKVYFCTLDRESSVPAYRELGIDVLSDAFTLERFETLRSRRRDQVRNFLLDKTALASIGNAYGDEILFEAGLHPKTFCHQLTSDEVARLHRAIRDVLTAAIEEIRRRDPPVDVKLRDFLKVRGRSGSPCPRCKTTLRSVRVGSADADFCPSCQPAGRRLFIDWKRRPAQ